MAAQSREEPDISLIAAYVDGRLSDAESRRLGHHIVACPRAWEILESLLPEGAPLPSPEHDPEEEDAFEKNAIEGETAETPSPVSVMGGANDAIAPSRTTRRSWQIALVASWLFVIVVGGWLWWADVPGLHKRIAWMEEQRRVTALQSARAEVGHLAQSTSGYAPIYAIGDPTIGLVRAAMQPQTRGLDQPPDDVRKQIDEKLAYIRSVLHQAESPGGSRGDLPLRLVEISSLILVGRLDEADTLLREVEEKCPCNQVRNARAVWQIATAQNVPGDRSQKLKAAAEETLQEIAPEGPPEAWLNLALYYLAEGDGPNAMNAFTKYLQTNPDAVVADGIRQEFGL